MKLTKMTQIKTTDNNKKDLKLDFNEEQIESFYREFSDIENKSLNDIEKLNPGLFIFPSKSSLRKDKIEENFIFKIKDKKIQTYNLMGFIGRNNFSLNITSRFYPNKNDFFLHYLLRKVFNLNIVNLKMEISNEPFYEFFLYLFPYFLKKALFQGLFKDYQHKKYNNANLKGSIDIVLHIRMNYPFLGKIAYQTREHAYDNRMTQLVRHTIEYIKTHPFGKGILDNDSETFSAVNQIIYSTPTYSKKLRNQIIQKNHKVIYHPYFTEYEPLRKICLQILRKEELSYGREKDKIYGILFDGAWLWEEYLNTVLKKENFIHPENKSGKNAVYVFKDKTVPRFPDFYLAAQTEIQKAHFVLDAKYQNLKEFYNNNHLNILRQMIEYLYIMKAEKGGFIFPYSIENNYDCVKTPNKYTVNGYGGKIYLFGLKINIQDEEYKDFIHHMESNENQLIIDIKEKMKNNEN